MLRSTVLLLLASILLPFAPLHAAAPASLVADINTLETSGDPSGGIRGGLLPFGRNVLFAVWEPGSGIEPWVSDGTAVGTRMLRDICPGDCWSSPEFLGRTNQVAVFQVRIQQPGGGERTELWRTNGTPEGTVPFKTSGLIRCFPEDAPNPAHEIGGVVVFKGREPGEDCGLWATNGSEAGTRRLAPEPLYRLEPVVEKPEFAGGKLFFFTDEGLWRTDGTAAGTFLLAQLRPGGDDYFDDPRLLTPAGSRVFFIAESQSGGGEELWTSDGTSAGTRTVTQFATEDPFPFDSRILWASGNTVYFLADDVTGGADLWQSDGTPAGTRRVTDFGYASPFNGLTIGKSGNLLVFLADDGLTGRRIWRSGGIPATTAPLEGCPGGCPNSTGPFFTLGGRVLFPGSHPSSGVEMWSTDGTGAGTRRVRDLCPGECSPGLSNFSPALGRLFFLAGSVLWSTDGTSQGTLRLADLGPSPFDPPFTPPFTPVTVDGKIVFAAGPDGDRQLWSSDGTPGGTGLVTLIGRNGPGSFPRGLTAFGDDVLFFAFDGQEHSLWRSGGTAASTVRMSATAEGASFASARGLTVVGGLAFFLRDEPFGAGVRVWRSDGTDAGTFPVSPTLPNVANLTAFRGRAVFTTFDFIFNLSATAFWESDGTVAGTRELFEIPLPVFGVRGLRALGPDLYFLANAGENSADEQVWASDGTVAGTRKITDFDSYAFDPTLLPEMIRVGSHVYFTAADRLWKTDGTAAGTAPVALQAGGDAGSPWSLVEFQGLAYFTGRSQQSAVGRGLWKTDGLNTVLVKPVAPSYDFFRPEPSWPTVIGSHLYFTGEDGVHGLELWRTDGTPDGTVLVRDIAPGSASSFPRELTEAGGRLFFRATNGVHGFELWESDGSASGTRMTQDISPGALSSHPEELTVADGRLFFSADDGISGTELWSLPLAGPAGCQTTDTSLCLGGRFRVEATWRDFQGNHGRGHAVSLTGDTGTFWFFDPANVEVVVKVLDGLGVNGHHWVFYGALSNVEYTLTVTDTVTGAARRYINPPGRLGSVGDTSAFGPKGSTGAQRTLGPAALLSEPAVTETRTAAAASCAPSATRLCLQGGRFSVEAEWRDFQGNTGKGMAVPLPGGDTGYFWFFNADNVEVVLKVLDGRPVNDRFWVFYGALSSVEYTLTVTDTETGKVKKYTNPSGRLASVADTGAF